MKKLFKIAIIVIILLNTYTLVYATERLVDIPVPPDNHGMADFTEEEAANQVQKKKKKQNNTKTDNYIEKSSNNYLKDLQVEGYELNPMFNSFNDTYTIYLKNKENIKSLKVIAQADNENAKIDGTGTVEIAPEQNEINIRVTAENGNLKIYKIKIEDETNRTISVSNIINTIQDVSITRKVAVITGILLILIIVIIVITKKKRAKNKK